MAVTHTVERRVTPDRRANSLQKTRLSTLEWVSMILMIVGGINWGLIGLFSFDLVAALFGPMSAMSRIVYTLVGLAALYSIFTLTRMSSSAGTPRRDLP
jgi:uncharacterized membrane protein YuzA (DUF378 family)